MRATIIAICLALITICTVVLVKCNKKGAIQKAENKATTQTDNEVKDILAYNTDTVNYYKDALGREHATSEELRVSLKTLNAVYPHKLDSMARNFNMKANQLKHAITEKATAKLKVRDSVKIINVYNNQNIITGYKVPIIDPDSTFSGQISINKDITKAYPDLIAHFGINAGIGWTRPAKMLWWRFRNFPFAKQRFVIDAYSDKRNVRVDTVKAIEILGRQ